MFCAVLRFSFAVLSLSGTQPLAAHVCLLACAAHSRLKVVLDPRCPFMQIPFKHALPFLLQTTTSRIGTRWRPSWLRPRPQVASTQSLARLSV